MSDSTVGKIANPETSVSLWNGPAPIAHADVTNSRVFRERIWLHTSRVVPGHVGTLITFTPRVSRHTQALMEEL